MIRGVPAVAWTLLLLAAAGGEAGAHPLAPALLEIRELAGGPAEVTWTTARAPGARVRPVLPPKCRAIGPPVAREVAASVTVRWTLDCEPQGLVGQPVGVEGLEDAGIEALVRVTFADGRAVSRVVRSGEPLWTIPERVRPLAVARGFGALGLAHILTGADHLLFVFGLLLLVGGAHLVRTVTAFTVGHSVTLSLAVLGIARLPSRPIEALIALSIFVLAVELARPADRSPSLLRRFPWGMALAFGLLHGTGFAAALHEVGLPEGEVALALASFNVGIEAGQLLFVAAALGAGRLLRARPGGLPGWARRSAVYVLGSLAAFWSLERVAAAFAA